MSDFQKAGALCDQSTESGLAKEPDPNTEDAEAQVMRGPQNLGDWSDSGHCAGPGARYDAHLRSRVLPPSHGHGDCQCHSATVGRGCPRGPVNTGIILVVVTRDSTVTVTDTGTGTGAGPVCVSLLVMILVV